MMNRFRLFAWLIFAAVSLTAPFARPALAQQAAAPSAQYRLGPGDVIRISVFQSPELSVEARLNEAGVISYPLLGSVQLGGLSVTDAERRIADGLRTGNFVKQPQVSILVSQVRGNQVSVLGQVGKPGRYPLESGEVHLTDILATAGGVSASGSDTVVVVGTRNGQSFRAQVQLSSVFAPGHRGDDLLLQNGDAVWVDRAPTIYVYGEVQKPGALRLERDMTVLQALAAAGGLTQRGTERGMRVHRREADGKLRVFQPEMSDALKPDDVLYLRESVF